MMMFWIPECMASSTPYWISGLSTTGSISFGCAFVAGRNRVPSPAAGNTALRTFAIILVHYRCEKLDQVSDRIFVAIPAYRDSELPATLIDMFRKAKCPERLRVVVAWQFARRETLPKEVCRLKNLEIIAIRSEESRGPNWARRLIQQRYDGESFTLLLDSHHRFVKH